MCSAATGSAGKEAKKGRKGGGVPAAAARAMAPNIWRGGCARAAGRGPPPAAAATLSRGLALSGGSSERGEARVRCEESEVGGGGV